MDDVLSATRDAMVAAVDGLLGALDTDGDVAASARASEDGIEALHDLLERRYGMGLISDWTDPDHEPSVGPVVRVRLAIDVLNEEIRDDVMSLVDERLCQDLDENRFAILSTTRVFPGARGSAADTLSAEPPALLLARSGRETLPPPRLGTKLANQRERLVDALQSLLESLAEYGEHPRNKKRRRVCKRQERFETRVEWLHRKVLRRTGSPLVTTWAYMWDDLPWSGPVVLRAVFDLGGTEATVDLLAAIAETLDGLAPDDFRLASATPIA